MPRAVRVTLITLVIVVVYGISLRQTEINLRTLITGIPNGLALVRDFLIPDVFLRESTNSSIEFDFPVPCGAASEAQLPAAGARLQPGVACAEVGDNIVVEGFELPPGAEVRLFWILQGIPDQRLRATSAVLPVDRNGYFQAEIEVRPLVAAEDGTASKLKAEISLEEGAINPSPALLETIDAAILTLFMALIATTLAALAAVPISFLAAANVMRHGRAGSAVYYLARSFLNITRTFEPLVLATIFGLWVGFGPFAGVLALTLFTVASLGKLFSEAVESIDPGPVEAVAATGANPVERIVYAIIPQIIPDFTSFMIYHWDINVRISTIIGFVGGGGIGFLLDQRLRSFSYHKAGTAIWAIVLMVWVLDFLSAEVRKRMV